MIDFPDDRLEPIEPGESHARPGSPDTFYIQDDQSKTPCTVIAVLRIKAECLTLWPKDAQPGQLYYLIDYGKGPELVGAARVHVRTEREKELRRLYVLARSNAVTQGMAREEFDRQYKARGLTLEDMERFVRIACASPHQIKEAIHRVFAIINIADSPIMQDGFLREVEREFFLPPNLVLAEWEQWQRDNGGRNKWAMAGVDAPQDPETKPSNPTTK